MSFCVYTTLFGEYEILNEQSVAKNSSIPFICFSDDPNLTSDTWEIRNVSPVFAMDPIRSQKDYKIRPHLHLKEFDYSLYIDNSVLLSQAPEIIMDHFNKDIGFCLPHHSFRDSVLDEFLEVSKLGFDDQGRIFEQLNHYTIKFSQILNERPFWGAILLRSHCNETVIRTLEFWYAQVLRYSRRDQLSINVAFYSIGLKPQVLIIDNFTSSFHSWPYTYKRNRDKGARNIAVSLAPPVGRIRMLEIELSAHESKIASLQSEYTLLSQKYELLIRSKTWRIANKVRFYLAKIPFLSRILGLLIDILWNIFKNVTSVFRYFKKLINGEIA